MAIEDQKPVDSGFSTRPDGGEDCNIAAPTDPESPMARFTGVDPHACSDEAAERLWAMSEEMLAGVGSD